MHNLRPDTFSLDALLMVVIVFPLEFQGNEKLPKLGGIIQKVKYIEGSAHGAVCVCTFHLFLFPSFFYSCTSIESAKSSVCGTQNPTTARNPPVMTYFLCVLHLYFWFLFLFFVNLSHFFSCERAYRYLHAPDLWVGPPLR